MYAIRSYYEEEIMLLHEIDHAFGLIDQVGVHLEGAGAGHILNGDGDPVLPDLLLKVVDRPEEFHELPFHGVITSYSIHYTKLYDTSPREPAGSWRRRLCV